MYFPYLRGRQFELIALRELVERSSISEKVTPIVEPVKLSSTLITTLNAFVKAKRRIALVTNPQVGEFRKNLDDKKNHSLIQKYQDVLKSPLVMKTHILNPVSNKELVGEKGKLIAVCTNKDYVANYESVFKDIVPEYNLVVDETRRKVKNNRVLLADRFKKKDRNSDYAKIIDEPYSEDHLYYEDEGYVGFADYSVIGDGYVESGFAPYAVAIHIVYFDKDNALRIRHFVSDTNDDISDPANKFAEALTKLYNWNNAQKLTTIGIKTFEELYASENYPGLGTVKKLTIMHHLELISQYLDGVNA